jgi:hypothetical protein
MGFEGIGMVMPTTVMGMFFALLVLVIIDAIMGAVKAGVGEDLKFDHSYFAHFIPNNLTKFILPLVIPALAGHFWHDAFYGLFIVLSLPVFDKFAVDIVQKWNDIIQLHKDKTKTEDE